jgi:hypothetical protein
MTARYRVIGPAGTGPTFRRWWQAAAYVAVPNIVARIKGSRYRWLIFYRNGPS